MTRGTVSPGPDEAARAPHALPEIGSTAAAVLAASPNAIIAVDAAGYVSYANPRVESTFGYLPEELVGQRLAVILPDRPQSRDHAGLIARRVPSSAYGQLTLDEAYRDTRLCFSLGLNSQVGRPIPSRSE